MSTGQRATYALALLFALYAIVSRVWVTEDAYITFRVVENLYAGHGLVFNMGERIEAFTHPLWMMVLVFIKGIGLSLHTGSILVGLVLTLGTIVFLFYRSLNRPTPAFPLAALALLSISGFRDFATGGMEYSLCFALLAIFFWINDSSSLKERAFSNAVLLGCLYLARPELGLLVAYYSVFAGIQCLQSSDFRSRFALDWRSGIKWAAGLLLTIGLWHLFRYAYYDDFFPNTYYAKAGLSTYYSQGLKYLMTVLASAPTIWIALAVILGFVLYQPLRDTVPPRVWNRTMMDLGAAALLTLYVIRVGGDFMAFRFLLPEIFMVFLALDRLWRHHASSPDVHPIVERISRPPLAILLILLFVLLGFWPVVQKHGIADERAVFVGPSIEARVIGNVPPQHLHPWDEGKAGYVSAWTGSDYPWGRVGHAFRKLRTCLAVDSIRITNSMTQARCLRGIGLGYFGVAAGPRVSIVDEQGLPNRSIATTPVLYRWRPGHEHYITLNQVIAENALFCSSGETEYDRIMRTDYGILLTLDPELLATVPGIRTRLTELRRLKSEGSWIIDQLEERDGMQIDSLLEQSQDWESDAFLRERYDCWELRGDRPALYFY